jgi:hypothetical protein
VEQIEGGVQQQTDDDDAFDRCRDGSSHACDRGNHREADMSTDLRPPVVLKLNDAGEVVAILDEDRVILGSKEAACEEMCRFLSEMDYGDCR